jgi:hypothetical protein
MRQRLGAVCGRSCFLDTATKLGYTVEDLTGSSSAPMLRIMQAVRAVATLLICLGLVVPSAHRLALCVGCDGSVALEIAIDGACAGALPGACCSQAMCMEESASHRTGIAARPDHEGCHDVPLGRDAVSPSVALSAKRLVSRPGSDAVAMMQSPTTPVVRHVATAGGVRPERGSPPPPFLTTVVLLI